MAAILIPSRATTSYADAWLSNVVTADAKVEFETFFLANYPATVRLLRSMGASEPQAQDAAQDAFVKLYTRWQRLRQHDSPEAWVRRVAINRLRDLHRSETRRVRREDRASEQDTSVEGADATLGENDRARQLLLELPRRQRTVAALFYIEELPIKDIAADLGISAGAVKFHLNRARASLRAALERETGQ